LQLDVVIGEGIDACGEEYFDDERNVLPYLDGGVWGWGFYSEVVLGGTGYSAVSGEESGRLGGN